MDNLKPDNPRMLQYTHLLAEFKGKYLYDAEYLKQTYDTLETVNCFNSIGVEYRSIFPVKIKTRPCIMILKRKPGIEIPPIDEIPPIGRIINIDEQIRQGAVNLNLSGYLEKNLVDKENDTVELSDSLNSNDDYDYSGDNEQHSQNNDDANSFVETELKKPSVETTQKLKRLIEKRYRMRKTSDNTEVAIKKGTTKSNIKYIIRIEKIKELIENISQMDLKTFCDLNTETTKSCLLKIIDSYDLE